MNFEELGAYMRILMRQFNCDALPIEMIKRVLGNQYEVIWPMVKEKFIQDSDGNFFNERLRLEKQKRKAFTQSRKDNLMGKHKESHKEKHTVKRMGNGNGDGNVNRNKDGIEIIYPFDSQFFIDTWEEWKEYKKSQFKFTYKSPKTEQRALKELSELAPDEGTAIKVIQRSIANGWKGFFKLDNNGRQSDTEDDLRTAAKVAEYLNGK